MTTHRAHDSPAHPRPLSLKRWQRAGLWSLGSLSGLASLGLGLQVNPAPFPALPEKAVALPTIPLPSGLPAPVERFYRLT